MAMLAPFDPVRLLLAGDTHHDTEWFLHLVDEAVRLGCHGIVQVGDFGFFPNEDYGREFLAAVQTRLAEAGIVTVFIDGNHDDHVTLRQIPLDADGFARLSPELWYAPRGARWSWQGVTFAAAGGAVSIDAARRVEGMNWWREETLSYTEIMRVLDGGPADVLLVHDAPTELGIVDEAKSDLASQSHRQGISALMEGLNPRLLVHGHYHHGHDTPVVHEAGTTRVLGLGMNGMEETGYSVLTLPDLLVA